MVERNRSSWAKVALLAVSALAALSLASGAAVAAGKCKKVDGTFVVLLTGDNLIQTARGDLLTKDAIVLKTTGARV